MDTPIRALEPSAGIGRFVRAFRHLDLDWNVVEASPLSARMLAALRPELAVHETSFEHWITANAHLVRGKLDLVVANPSYGPRGLHLTEDPDRSFRQRQAWAYFRLRCLDLLRADVVTVKGESSRRKEFLEHSKDEE